MQIKSALAVLSLSLACLAPRASFADTLTLTAVGGQSTNGVYVYPYTFTVNGEPGVNLSCLNFDREVTVGESWTVNAVAVSSIGAAGLDGETQKAYIEDAYLFNLYSGATTAQQISDIQFAIWGVMDYDGVKGLSGYTDGNAAILAGHALDAYLSSDHSFAANDWVFVPNTGTPGKGQPQIFMGDPPSSVTPEPSSLILLGTGLLGMCGAARRRLVRA